MFPFHLFGFKSALRRGLSVKRIPSLHISSSSRKAFTDPQTKFTFVGGKGGVGKTTSSSAIALRLADSGLRTLIVSTDPAHSLGDALDVNLSSGSITPIVTDPNLWALEIDVDAALDDFKSLAKDLEPENLSESLGVPKQILESVGLDDLTKIFTNPPPGIDEIIALIKVFEFADQKSPSGDKPRFDRIVIDTAPTGHTVRLLQLPEFLNSITGKLIKFRTKLQSTISSFKNLFNPDGNLNSNIPKASPLDKLENIQIRLEKMRNSLKNSKETQFIIISIPTTLAVAESMRLVDNLQQEGISISSLICNQVVSDDASSKYITTRKRSQQSSLLTIQSNKPSDVQVTEVPYFDTEVTGIYGLRFFASIAHKVVANSPTNPISSRKLTIFGGKGGVGKTTSAAAWAVQLADAGMRTLVVSTDPAHSLGDSFKEPLTGSPRLLDTTSGGGQLWAMEIDPQSAIEEFKEIIEDAMMENDKGTQNNNGNGNGNGGGDLLGGMMGGLGLSDLKKELVNMVSGVKDPPPGTDEVVALTRVVSMLEEGYTTPNGNVIRFDRIVLDTAPTGHTLRMLTLPVFLQELLGKLRSVRDKMGSMGMAGAGAPGSGGIDRLAKFQNKMKRLEDILHSPKECEFAVVTIPTQVAVAETKRLLQALEVEDILVRRIIVNQVILEQGAQDADEEVRNQASISYLNRMRDGQRRSIAELQSVADRISVPLVKVPYFEMETRTVYGLRAIGNSIFSNTDIVV
eukprot:gene4598-9134_t